ncbi:AraC-type DNA-binding protein [Andreprevotia lacus DSM 23236]|jgi:AraC-like DNA-binding protein|uniref:AraC-type DNA-binding protein n=1 Tax=Andreprevotia lacus DSM 23236 TaxID=1121001 RepID=A0A1W1XTX6_9NEIS|nr:AraC family transcriptional regulator [Andreprevotia lacus]SMC27305.1 AraC-type DNA-binding protein [Andreprevotia lacus DSM 23236]
MATIYHEKFEVSAQSTQHSVGGRSYCNDYLHGLLDRGILLAGVSQLREHHYVERLDAPFHVLLCCQEGHGHVLEGDTRRPLGPGQLVVLPAHRHGGFVLGSPYWRLAWLVLDDVAAWDFLKQPQALWAQAQAAESLYLSIACLHQEVQLGQRGHTQGALQLMLDTLQREMTALQAARRPTRAQQLGALLEKIYLNPATCWTVPMLAGQLGMSQTTLTRLCQQQHRATPQQLIIAERMKRAYAWLQTGYGNVTEVATACGYEEVASFSRRFAQHFGLPPGQIEPRYAPGAG